MAQILPRSLLDRLIDDNPDVASEPMMSDGESFEDMKAGLRRDLEGLLNARRPFSSWLSNAPDLAGTVVDFGLPDLSTEDFGTEAVRERIRRMIAQCIRTHEPRLNKVEVEKDGGPSATGVHFRISAVISYAGYEAEVIYDARLRPTDRAIDVSLAN